MSEKVKENPYVKMILDTQEKMFYAYYKENTHIGLEEAKKIVADRLALQKEGEKYVAIISMEGKGPLKVTKEARDYLAWEDTGIKAHAICTQSKFETMLVFFYLTFSKPKVPAKVFHNPQKAINWLKEMRDKEE